MTGLLATAPGADVALVLAPRRKSSPARSHCNTIHTEWFSSRPTLESAEQHTCHSQHVLNLNILRSGVTCESVGIRWALTELGARTPVVPPLTARLRATAANDAPGWPTAHFTEIINDLADHAQVILYSQFWRVDAGRTYGVSGTGLDWELDWTAPWEHLVEESRTWSLLEASEAPTGSNIFVAPTWIDRTDLHPER